MVPAAFIEKEEYSDVESELGQDWDGNLDNLEVDHVGGIDVSYIF